MAAPLEDMVMSAFEDLIQLSQDEKNEIQREIDSSENEFDESTLKPMDASSLAKHELDAELEKRGIHPKGFKSDDEKTLQAKINEELSNPEYNLMIASFNNRNYEHCSIKVR